MRKKRILFLLTILIILTIFSLTISAGFSLFFLGDSSGKLESGFLIFSSSSMFVVVVVFIGIGF
jgi:uncharacterized SAM-binding protein YcdF (DUF218 family)